MSVLLVLMSLIIFSQSIIHSHLKDASVDESGVMFESNNGCNYFKLVNLHKSLISIINY